MNKPTKLTDAIEVAGNCACYRPAGRVTLEQAESLVDLAIAFARDRLIPKLLVNCTQLTGFPSPTLPQRYFAVHKWAKTAQGRVQVALVVRPEMIDPEKFGITVAQNAGWHAEVYPTELEARAWLELAPDGKAPPPGG